MSKKGQAITDINKIKSMEIDILDEIVRVCDKEGYKYFIAYGTLLGAIRHKGFIPWDDDIDIIMPRDDYEALCAKWDNSGRYKMLECKRDHKYIYPFAKVSDSSTIMEEHNVLKQCDLGIYVDIFPYDNVAEERKEDSSFIRKCELYEKFRMYSMFPVENILSENKKKNFGRKIIWRIIKAVGPEKISRYQDKTAMKYKNEKTKFKGCLCTRYSEREILPADVYDDVIKVEFEGKMYNAPKQYDLMLTRLYGDYMELPPKEERVLKHNFKVWNVR